MRWLKISNLLLCIPVIMATVSVYVSELPNMAVPNMISGLPVVIGTRII